MVKTKTTFYCTACGNESPKWQGKCSACGSWNTIVEHVERPNPVTRGKSNPVGTSKIAQNLNDVSSDLELRFSTGMRELDRVLGGGAVAGSLVLVGGAPGIGKSTLLLQICNSLCLGRRVLYISGEESERQLKLRAKRIGVSPESLYILSETRLSDIFDSVAALNPDVLIIDSVQTLYNEQNESMPGSISQVKDCTMSLMQLAKTVGVTVFVVGHINKDGAIAGPKVLEHMVDCVLYFEGSSNSPYRLLRAAKNRFGSTNEIGVFEMGNRGLIEVPNPSQIFLNGRPDNASGTCVACVMEGTRPMLAEIQALVLKSAGQVPRRAADGFDFNRALLLMAVAEKQTNLRLSSLDAYINVIGGLNLNEPGVDLPVVLALASSCLAKPINSKLVAIGEVGLVGELRSVSNTNQRLIEVARLGFKYCIIPKNNVEKLEIPKDLYVYQIKNIKEAIEVALKEIQA